VTDSVDAVVIGAGVVGLATGRALAARGLEVLVLDGERQFGSWTSSRNSEVIHAGLYYAPGSLKARLCVAGRDLLYDYCARRQVPHRRTGKLIFGSSAAELLALDAIMERASAAGVYDLLRLDAVGARALEPALACAEAILSPSTGIVDAHGFMLAMLADLEGNGGLLVCNSAVRGLSRLPGDRWGVHLDEGGRPDVAAALVVNSAGLAAHAMAGATEGFDPDLLPALRFARGVYYGYSGRLPFRHLIYPVPVPGGLGTHLTLDVEGRGRFGPNVEWMDGIDYRIAPDPERTRQFLEAALRIWPEIDPGRLEVGFAGVRPKLSGPGEEAADFLVLGPAEHGLPGLVGLFGIESPGLTASLALARLVEAKLGLAAEAEIHA
jgi:L-2-hydroxyglutarate oxidase LhgO